MTYTDIQKLLLDKYKNLTELSNQIVELINKKNEIDTNLQILQLRRQSIVDSINTIESKCTALIDAGLTELLNSVQTSQKITKAEPAIPEIKSNEVKSNISKAEVKSETKKELKNKTEFSMQPTIASEKKGK